MTPIFLIGYMCSGKTTLGEALARALHVDFIDLDDLVERRAGMPVSQIFATRGEEAFRQMELEALECASSMPAVIACGGGTPCRPAAISLINARGTSVLLRPCEDRLITRLMLGRAKRPLITGIADEEEMRQFARKAMAQREPYYAQARFTFDSSFLENEAEIEQSVGRFIQEILDGGLDQQPEEKA